MIQKQKIKKLAQLAAAHDLIPKDIEQYVLTSLLKQDLKDFLRYYREELDNKRVYIQSPKALTADENDLITKMYKGKDLVVTLDDELGAGLLLRENDMIIDFSFRGYINGTIDKLKN